LSTYYVAVKAAGVNFDHMAAYFLLVMGDAPSLWLNNLPAGNFTSWADLSQAFTSNFQATYNHPGNTIILGRVTMKTNERLRDYTNQFFENRNTCVGVQDDQVVDSYKKGIRDRKISEKIHESGATTVVTHVEVVNKLIDADEALVNQFDSGAKQDVGTSGTTTDLSSKLRKQPSEVLVTEGRRPSTFNVDEFNAVLDSPCTFQDGAPTPSTNALNSRGRPTPQKTQSNLEAITINVSVAMTVAAMTGNVMSSSQRTAVLNATYLLHRRQETPMAPSSRPRGLSI
jgi:hypothetical protein